MRTSSIQPGWVGSQPSTRRVMSIETGLSSPANPARCSRYYGASSAVTLRASMPSRSAIVSAIVRKGMPRSPAPGAAALAAHAGVVVFRVAFAEWVRDEDATSLRRRLHDVLLDLHGVTAPKTEASS